MAYYKDYDEDDIYEEPTDDISDEDLTGRNVFENMTYMDDDEFEDYFQELIDLNKSCPQILMPNIPKLKKVKEIYKELVALFNEYGAEYKINIKTYEISNTSLGMEIIFDNFAVISDDFDKLKKVLDVINTVEISPTNENKIKIGMTIEDVFINITEA